MISTCSHGLLGWYVIGTANTFLVNNSYWKFKTCLEEMKAKTQLQNLWVTLKEYSDYNVW